MSYLAFGTGDTAHTDLPYGMHACHCLPRRYCTFILLLMTQEKTRLKALL